MPGDYSRKIFDKKKNYSGVLMQQGRVQLDSDWNEQLDIGQHRSNTETKDVIGASGVPKKEGGFEITATADSLTISPGRIYADGLLFELEKLPSATTYFNQPYYPNPDLSNFIQGNPSAGGPASLPSSPASPPESPASPPEAKGLINGTYIVYLQAWQRERNFRDDPRIQEIALGEADTTTRLQNVWQVKLLKIPNEESATCKSDVQAWNKLIAPSTGRLNARTKPNADLKDPCVLPPGSGYRSLENQLYRVEVHTGGDSSTATFKWSRDNGSIETTIEKVSGSILTVSDTGKDEVLGFAPGQWVEIIDEESTLKNKPNSLYQIDSVDPDTYEIALTNSVEQFKNQGSLKLRRWENAGAGILNSGINMSGGWIDLEDGLQVEFKSGDYKSGDYWLIPARTATGEIEWPPYEIPNLNPAEQPPLGIHWHYCRLALLQVQNDSVVVTDCRALFPSLTEICAEDICFNNDNCDFAVADNVQEALDLLCAANDLRTHNKLLHGSGVVCGLKIICGQERKGVTIEQGYALDCDGNIIHVKDQGGLSYNVVGEAAVHQLLDQSGTGTVCLKISGTGKNIPLFTLEKYVKQDFWEEILEGSLIKDFYQDCIEKLILFLKSQLVFSLTDDAPVTLQQRRLTSLINLFSQLINSGSGPYAFLSGTNSKEGRVGCGPNSTEKRTEDHLLWCFYQELKNALASETFCGMNDRDHPYPEYILDPGLETIFGPPLKFHTVVRLHPTGKYAYTFGNNNKIYVYDLKSEELIQSIAFPANTSMRIQDIAISKENVIYAVGVQDSKDSEFAMGNITNGKIAWKGTSMHCAFIYVKLALTQSGKLYATVKGKGLYEISGITASNFSSTIRFPFNATGLLLISKDDNSAYAAVSTTANVDMFNQVQTFALNAGGSTPPPFLIQGTDAGNDMLIDGDRIYISGSNSSGQIVSQFNITGQLVNTINLEPSTFVRLSMFKGKVNTLLITLSDKCKVVRADLKDSFLTPVNKKMRIPVQLFPMSIVISPDSKTGYVLNSGVNTLTRIQMEQVFKPGTLPNFAFEPPAKIAAYRDGVIAAYKDLFSHLLQSLKDCFFDKFLVDCPTCKEKESVYLGTIEIRNGKVYHICNFTKRKYVKSFPTVEYWMSTVPILPIFKKAFAQFACMVLEKKP